MLCLIPLNGRWGQGRQELSEAEEKHRAELEAEMVWLWLWTLVHGTQYTYPWLARDQNTVAELGRQNALKDIALQAKNEELQSMSVCRLRLCSAGVSETDVIGPLPTRVERCPGCTARNGERKGAAYPRVGGMPGWLGCVFVGPSHACWPYLAGHARATCKYANGIGGEGDRNDRSQGRRRGKAIALAPSCGPNC